MRTIIAGSRGFNSLPNLARIMQWLPWQVTTVLSGTAQGADKLGEQWAALNGLEIERYPANWKEFGKSAGYKRNQEMAANAHALVAFWDGSSRGTKHMIDLARKAGLRIFVVNTQTGEEMNHESDQE